MHDAGPDDLGDAQVVLADGRTFRGRGFGARTTRIGEVVFNTSMTGYEEMLSDPSYAGQLLCLTVAEVGNVGCNAEDRESSASGAEGVVVRSLSPIVSNWRAQTSLPQWLAERGVPGVAEVDTRALTRHLRNVGSILGAISTDGTELGRLRERIAEAPPMVGRGLAASASTRAAYSWDAPTWDAMPRPVDLHVVALDFGIKHNILRCLRDEGIRTTVMPGTSSAAAVLAANPDGVVLSNGPGDPAALPETVEEIAQLLALAPDVPVLGICLGHQLLGLALGGRTFKLKFGHHGGNHPVRNAVTGAVEITSQNHGFAIDPDSLRSGAAASHVNLFDATLAGLRLRDRPVLGVQYHPEASPGPHDARAAFAEFARLMRRRRSVRNRS